LSSPSFVEDCAVFSGTTPGATPVTPAITPPSVGTARRNEVDVDELASDEDSKVLDLERVDLEVVDIRERFEYVCVALLSILKTGQLLAKCKLNDITTYVTWNFEML
jgi:hypothetical protein